VSERKHLIAVLVCLALIVGLLTWATLGTTHTRCVYAVTYGQHQFGYQEVPCDASPREQFQYLKDHPKIHPGPPPSN
jgi:hypothetical protein